MRGPLGRRLTVGVAIFLAALLATGVLVAMDRSEKSAPPWAGDLRGCRIAPTTHVHNPRRIKILKSCSTLTGKVRSVKLVAAYDDLKVTVIPDDNLRSYLPKANKGVVVADVIATDQASVNAPPVGSRITAWGAWVLDKATKTALLLPAYRIVINQLTSDTSIVSGRSVEKHGPPVRRQLRLTVKTGNKVVVGGRIDVTLQAEWLQNGQLKPASEIRLFTEMTAVDGTGVRWKATMTDTRGTAVLHLVAIQVPDAYLFTAYAAPSRQPVSAATPIRVTKA